MTHAYATGYLKALADAGEALDRVVPGTAVSAALVEVFDDMAEDFKAENAEAFDEVGSH
jgi:hypothetical protein